MEGHAFDEPGAPGGPGGGDHGAAARAEPIPLSGVLELVVGLSWDENKQQESPLDLDASACCFDRDGNFLTAIYFGQLANENGSILHSGDSRTGEGEGDDEQIVIKLPQVPAAVRAICVVVNSYSGQSFASVRTASCRVLSIRKPRGPEVEMGKFVLSPMGGHTGLIMAHIIRSTANSAEWVFQPLDQGAEGRSFADLLPAMQRSLAPVIPHIRVLARPDVIALSKGETVELREKNHGPKLKRITIGLGWDPIGNEAVDLDASCVMFDQFNRQVDAVFFNHLRSCDGSVRHAGDNLTGEGDGDDEQMFVDLDQIRSDVRTLFILVNSYSSHPFSRLKNAYVRILSGTAKSKQGRGATELMRFELGSVAPAAAGPGAGAAGGNNGRVTAMLMCKLTAVQEPVADFTTGSGSGARSGAGSGTEGLPSQGLGSTGAGAGAGPGAGTETSESQLMTRRWNLKALGYAAQGTMYKDNLPDMQKELAGRLKLGEGTGFTFKLTSAPVAAAAQEKDNALFKVIVLVMLIFFILKVVGKGK